MLGRSASRAANLVSWGPLCCSGVLCVSFLKFTSRQRPRFWGNVSEVARSKGRTVIGVERAYVMFA